MKILGIVTQELQKEEFQEATKILKRRDNEAVRYFSIGNFHLSLVSHPHEHFIIHETDESFFYVYTDQVYKEIIENKTKRNTIQDIFEDLKEFNPFIIQFEKKENRLSLLSDYFGVRTIYHTQMDREFCFSTEKKSIVSYYGKKRFKIDREGLIELLLFQFQWGKKTIIEEISILEPRIIMNINANESTLSCNTYAQFPTETVKEINLEFLKSIDSNFGSYFSKLNSKGYNLVWLSGGLDSRYILEWLVKSSILVNKIINFGPEYIPDVSYAKDIVSHFSLKPVYENYVVNADIIVKHAKNHIYINEGYSGHINSHLLHSLEKLDENSNHIFFDGYLGDIILGGTYSTKVLGDLYSSLKFDIKYLLRALSEPFKKEILGYVSTAFEELVSSGYNKNDRKARKLEHMVYDNYGRRHVMMGGPKIAEDFGLVHRPFFNRIFFDKTYLIPIELRTKHQVYRRIIDEFHKEIKDYPSTSLQLKSKKESLLKKYYKRLRLLLVRALERIFKISIKKPDNYVDPNTWLRNNENYRDFVMNIITSKEIEQRNLFNVSEIRKMLKEHLNYKHNFGFLFARILDIELTLQLFTDYER